MQKIFRIFKTTLKQIKRSGWLAFASIAQITLSFLITTIFVSLAFVMNLVLRSIESEPHIYVFFQPGTTEQYIQQISQEWENHENIEDIIYTPENEAMKEFVEYNKKNNPIVADSIREGVLPSSLGFRVKKIVEIDPIIEKIEQDAIEDSSIITVGYSKSTIDNIKDISTIVRTGGGIIVALLVIVILLFTLLTVEFKIFNRAEEIGVMQLVGGSLWYIRAPFILESTIYGVIGAMFSNILLIGSGFAIQHYYSDSFLEFINRFFGNLPWPEWSIYHSIGLFLAILTLGGFLGMINSYFAIRRYIK